MPTVAAFLFDDGKVNAEPECSVVVLRLLLGGRSASDVDFVHARLLDGLRQLQRHSAVAGHNLESVPVHAVKHVVVAVVSQVLVGGPNFQDMLAPLGLVHGYGHFDQVPVGAVMPPLVL